MRRLSLSLLTAIALAAYARGQTLEGEVVDKLTRAPLAGRTSPHTAEPTPRTLSRTPPADFAS